MKTVLRSALLGNSSSSLLTTKIKEKTFLDRDKRKLIQYLSFTSTLDSTEKQTWDAFSGYTKNFHGDNKSDDFPDEIIRYVGLLLLKRMQYIPTIAFNYI